MDLISTKAWLASERKLSLVAKQLSMYVAYHDVSHPVDIHSRAGANSMCQAVGRIRTETLYMRIILQAQGHTANLPWLYAWPRIHVPVADGWASGCRYLLA